MSHRTMATDIRRGILMIAGAIRKGMRDGDSGVLTLVEVLEACADGIRDRFGASDPRTKR